MGKFGGIELSETKLCGATSYSGTITVGYTEIAKINYGSTDINNNITEVTDIDNPTSWTNLIDISGSEMLILMSNDSPNSLYLLVGSGEDPDNALRIQVLKNTGSWNTIWDGKAVRNASGNSECKCKSVATNLSYMPSPISIQPIYCSSFKIRAVRHGTFSGSSYIQVPTIYYSDVERI